MYVLSAGADVDARLIDYNTKVLSYLLPLPRTATYLTFYSSVEKSDMCRLATRQRRKRNRSERRPGLHSAGQWDRFSSDAYFLPLPYCTYSMYMQSGGRGCVGTIGRAVSGIASGDGQTGRQTDSVVSCRAF